MRPKYTKEFNEWWSKEGRAKAKEISDLPDFTKEIAWYGWNACATATWKCFIQPSPGDGE